MQPIIHGATSEKRVTVKDINATPDASFLRALQMVHDMNEGTGSLTRAPKSSCSFCSKVEEMLGDHKVCSQGRTLLLSSVPKEALADAQEGVQATSKAKEGKRIRQRTSGCWQRHRLTTKIGEMLLFK